MPKEAAQRMSRAEIRAAHLGGTPVAVYTGFKRGFTMNAAQATIHSVGNPRTVFASAEDLIGRDLQDGVEITYIDSPNDTQIVAPSDILSVWDEYIVQRDAILKARAVAQSAAGQQRSTLNDLVGQMGVGHVITYNAQWGIFLPYEAAMNALNTH